HHLKPSVIVQVHTVPATIPDSVVVEPIARTPGGSFNPVGRSRLQQCHLSCRASQTKNRNDRPTPGVNQLAGTSRRGI
ncbi:MAG: hypothetical protein J2P36_29545, partial [Ktedonobacteraceae bacterium]|nr:hypothetical protein [Ktedonobacteraceae bacterium]